MPHANMYFILYVLYAFQSGPASSDGRCASLVNWRSRVRFSRGAIFFAFVVDPMPTNIQLLPPPPPLPPHFVFAVAPRPQQSDKVYALLQIAIAYSMRVAPPANKCEHENRRICKNVGSATRMIHHNNISLFISIYFHFSFIIITIYNQFGY
jgi:hypothetical protein